MAQRRIIIKDKTFEVAIPEATILEAVANVARSIKKDYAERNPYFLIVLNGAFVFASDVIRLVDYPCSVGFTKLKSYVGTNTDGNVTELLAVPEDVKGRNVIILEDIVDRGYTMQYLLHRLKEAGAASSVIGALSLKPDHLMVPGLPVRYTGMTLPEAFIVGYGLDYDGQGRTLRDIYAIVED